MSEIESGHIAIRFVNEINRHDLVALASLMAPDFRYVDSQGHETRGRERMCQAWTALFEAFPEYRIAIREHVEIGQVVALFGTASGVEAASADAHRRWTIPAAWRAVVSEGHITEWHAYGGREPLSRIPAPVDQADPPFRRESRPGGGSESVTP